MSMVDIAIPLGPGSKANNDELRLFLRSLEENGRGWRRVLLMTDCAPGWLVEDGRLRVYPIGDRHKHNKDANLFEKLNLALAITDGDCMAWTCDDCVLLKPCDFSELLPIYNPRGRDSFAKPADGKDWGKWQCRMWHTLEELGISGYNWDAHVPQRWHVSAAKEAIAATPYKRAEGRCINTAVLGRTFGGSLAPECGICQDAVKETVQTEEGAASAKMDKMFLAYNDSGFLHGLRERLFERFPKPSRWEAER